MPLHTADEGPDSISRRKIRFDLQLRSKALRTALRELTSWNLI